MLGRSQGGQKLLSFKLTLYYTCSIFPSLSSLVCIPLSHFLFTMKNGGLEALQNVCTGPLLLVPNIVLFPITTTPSVGAETVRKIDSPALSLQSIQHSLTLITISNYTVISAMQIKSREV